MNTTEGPAGLSQDEIITTLFAAQEPFHDPDAMQRRFDAWLDANTDTPQLAEAPRPSPDGAWANTPALLGPLSAGPMMQRLVLGGRMRRLREDAYITTEQAAAAIRGSSSKISRLEHGRVGFKQRDIADLLTLYGVTSSEVRESLLRLAWEANEPSWWQSYSDALPHWVVPYLDLEATATVIRSYEVQLVPGLLQTEAYARAVIRLGRAGSFADEERRVEARLSRTDILGRDRPPRLRIVIDEAALRRDVGGEAVMREQLEYLIEVTENPAVRLQVLPFSAGAHAAMGGAFTILGFTEPELRAVVYLEQLTSALYLEKPAEVSHYSAVFEQVAAHAETPEDTPQLLKEILTDI